MNNQEEYSAFLRRCGYNTDIKEIHKLWETMTLTQIGFRYLPFSSEKMDELWTQRDPNFEFVDYLLSHYGQESEGKGFFPDETRMTQEEAVRCTELYWNLLNNDFNFHRIVPVDIAVNDWGNGDTEDRLRVSWLWQKTSGNVPEMIFQEQDNG